MLLTSLTRILLASLALFAAPAWAAGEAEKNAGAASREARGDRLPATEFVTLDPFTVPVVVDGKFSEQFTVVIALELAEEDVRDEVVQLTPRVRNEIYQFLFKSVTFRTGEPRIPRTSDLRTQLFRVVHGVVGPEHVKSIVVQQAVRSTMP
jgi:flagellar basal body-associated protein FliL